jgi:hypothetical protein
MTDLVFLEPNKIDAIPFTTSDVIAEYAKCTDGMKRVYVFESNTGLIKIGVS